MGRRNRSAIPSVFRSREGGILAMLSLGFLALAASSQPAAAGGAFGPDTCINGYVWREANPRDHVCVKPDEREQAKFDNEQARYRREPAGGAFGPDTCRSGYVWREAYNGDVVCVTPEQRERVRHDNEQAPYLYAK